MELIFVSFELLLYDGDGSGVIRLFAFLKGLSGRRNRLGESPRIRVASGKNFQKFRIVSPQGFNRLFGKARRPESPFFL